MTSGRRVGQRPDGHTFLCKFGHFQTAIVLHMVKNNANSSRRVSGNAYTTKVMDRTLTEPKSHLTGSIANKIYR